MKGNSSGAVSNFANGFQRLEPEISLLGLISQNHLNWAFFFWIWLDWFCLHGEFSKVRWSVCLCFDLNWPSLTSSLFTYLPINTAHRNPQWLTYSLLQFLFSESQFLCYSQVNSSFWQFSTGLSLPLYLGWHWDFTLEKYRENKKRKKKLKD